MCLIAIAWQVREDLPLVVAANRDEWRERPAQPAHWWADHPGILAGRDLQAGGTWMGITRGGRFAAVTNFRDPSDKRTTARSRGELVTDFLLGHASGEAFARQLTVRAQEYNGFNLLMGDGASLWYFGSRSGRAHAVEPGIHALSNHVLDEPWPKVVRAREAMARAVGAQDIATPLFDFLADRQGADDSTLPQTGVGLAWERRLSSALITGEDYGTRASTLLVVDGAGHVRLEERTLDPAGITIGTVSERYFLHAAGRDRL